MKWITWLAVLVLAVPVSAFAFYKPARVLIPEPFGVSCHRQNVCVDDLDQLDAAAALLDSARRHLETQWGLSLDRPRAIFCSTISTRSGVGRSLTSHSSRGRSSHSVIR